jgi:hypothetical protein
MCSLEFPCSYIGRVAVISAIASECIWNALQLGRYKSFVVNNVDAGEEMEIFHLGKIESRWDIKRITKLPGNDRLNLISIFKLFSIS